MERFVEDRALDRFRQFRAGPFAEETEPFQPVRERGVGARSAVGIVEACAEGVERDGFLRIQNARKEKVAHGEDALAQLRFQTRVAQADDGFEIVEHVVAREFADGREAAPAGAPATQHAVRAQVAGDGLVLDQPE